MTIRAVTFDYWDTIYAGAVDLARVGLREAALRRLVERVGRIVPEDFAAHYRATAEEADRWWRDDHRGYSTQDRIRWLLKRLEIERPEHCEQIEQAVRDVDDALLDVPPPLLPGARDALSRLSSRFTLGIISDTGFASGHAQNRLLERDELLSLFAVTIYSMDIGHAKPRAEPFTAAVSALGVPPGEIVHIGDNEHTDVRGALSAGLRAVRVDIVNHRGPSDAEFVARSYEELVEYLATHT